MRKLSPLVRLCGVNKVVKAHPQGFCGAVEDQGQEDWQGAAEDDEGSYRDGLAGCQWHGDDDDQQFADDQVDGHCAGVVARLALEDEAAYGAAFIRFENAGEYFAPATYRAALAQSPF